MPVKLVLVFCVQTLLTQLAMTQSIGCSTILATPLISNSPELSLELSLALITDFGISTLPCEQNLGAPLAPGLLNLVNPSGATTALDFTPTSGGSLLVTSYSPITPIGISITSENCYEGTVFVAGELPLLGLVSFANAVSSFGTGVINHACGNGLNIASDVNNYYGTLGVNGYVNIGYGGIESNFGVGSVNGGVGYEVPGYENFGCGANNFGVADIGNLDIESNFGGGNFGNLGYELSNYGAPAYGSNSCGLGLHNSGMISQIRSLSTAPVIPLLNTASYRI